MSIRALLPEFDTGGVGLFFAGRCLYVDQAKLLPECLVILPFVRRYETEESWSMTYVPRMSGLALAVLSGCAGATAETSMGGAGASPQTNARALVFDRVTVVD